MKRCVYTLISCASEVLSINTQVTMKPVVDDIIWSSSPVDDFKTGTNTENCEGLIHENCVYCFSVSYISRHVSVLDLLGIRGWFTRGNPIGLDRT